jgi:3-oxoacyl-[acyl-carrier protein] reductase
MLLEGKNAVIYGAAGSIGGAVARAFAGEGARVFLAGRTRETLDAVAGQIRSAGGGADTAVVDALDERAVDEHADAVAAAAGGIDISLNATTHPSAHGKPIAEMELEDFTNEVTVAVSTTFLTARAAARHMIRQGSGVILVFGGTGPPLRNYYIGGTQVALGAIDLMRRQLAAELGPHGIRVVTLRTGGVPESIPETSSARAEIERMIVADTMLGRAATLEDVGNVAAFVASDRARTMTGATANISCGALVD